MKAPKLYSLLATLLFCGAVVPTAHAVRTISINFTDNGDAGTQSGFVGAGEPAGAPGVRTTNWNNVVTRDAGGVAIFDGVLGDNEDVYYDDGTVVGGGFTFSPSQFNFSDRSNGSFTNDREMFNGVKDAFGGNFNLTLTNIPFAEYDVYCYMFDDGSGRIGRFTIGGTTYYVRGGVGVPDSTGAGYVLSTDTTTGTLLTDHDQGNYVKFSSLATNAFLLVVDAVGVEGNLPRNKMAGFQIVERSAATVTNISLGAAIPTLLQGNPSGFGLSVIADFDDGSSAVVTGEPETTYLSQDTNVFVVSATGTITPKQAGSTNVIVAYNGGLFLTNLVTVEGPTSLSLGLSPNTLQVGNGVGDNVPATLTADFPSQSGVNVTAFNYVSFSSTSAGVVSVSSGGVVTAVGVGSFDLIGSYAGLSATNDPAGTVSAFTAPAGADGISVNITDSNNPMDYKSLAGVPGARFAYWNNFPLNGATASNEVSGLRDFQGNVVAGTVATITAKASGGNGSFPINPLGSNDETMFRTVYDSGLNNPAHYTNQSGIIIVSNVPYAKYDVYFYTWNDNGTSGTNRAGYFRPLEQDKYYTRLNMFGAPSNPLSDGTGYVEAVPQVFNGSFGGNYPALLTDVPQGNFIKVSGLTNSDLAVEWGAVGPGFFDDDTGIAGVARMRFSGFQIVKSLEGLTATNIYLQSAVPDLLPADPATFVLTVLGDFSDGTTGGNISGLPGISFASENTSVFSVTPEGIVQAGDTPGVANLVINYQSVSYTQAVTTLTPSNIRVVAQPDTYYLDSGIGTDVGQARLLADFPGRPGEDVSGFTGVTFSGPEPGIASVDSAGVITATGAGEADITGNYLGSPTTTPDVVTVGSISAVPVLKHRYSFRDGGSTIEDSVGNADGTAFPALGGFMNITLDGERAHFPGDSDYTTAPYISFAPGLVTERGDITIEMWVGVNTVKTWARFFASGQTTKGTDPHNSGNGTGLSFLSLYASYAGTGNASLSYSVGGSGADLQMTNAFGTGIERHIVAVYAPHRGVAKVYVDGELLTNNVPASSLTGLIDDVVWLGVSRWNDSTLDGWFNELRIHEGAFSDTDVADSFAAGPNVGLPPLTPPEVPALSIETSGANVVIAWPTNAVGYVLKSNTVITLPWSPVGIAPTVVGTNNTVTVPAGSGASFFILEK